MGEEEMPAASVPNRISNEEIRHRYFGNGGLIESPVIAAADFLTPTAKYVAQEARKRLGQHSAIERSDTPDEEELFRLVSTVEQTEGEELSERERTAVVASLSASLDDFDILSPLVENSEVNDIIVQSYKDISIQCGRRNIQTGLRFADHVTYKSFVENLLKRAGKACTVTTPVVDASIDSNVRACVTHESFSPQGCGPMVTLRIARHRRISLESLVNFELAPRAVLDYLAVLVRSGLCTVLLSGEVGTGKTTLAKALALAVPEDEAILVIEDTHELVLERSFVRTLLTREANSEGAGRIAPAQAIRTGMRMAMNRIILGEMRDAEAAEAFIDVCASGHAGLSTIHARSARDALTRLELFLARAQGQVGVETIRRQIANALSVIIFLGLDRAHGKRRIFEVVEVGTSSDGIVQVSPIFSFSPDHRIPEWKRDSGVSRYHTLLVENGVRLGIPGERVSLEPEQLYTSFAVNGFGAPRNYGS